MLLQHKRGAYKPTQHTHIRITALRAADLAEAAEGTGGSKAAAHLLARVAALRSLHAWAQGKGN